MKRILALLAAMLLALPAAAQTLSAQAPNGLALIASQSPSGTGTVTFGNIPTIYRDLRVVVRGAATNAATFSEVHMQFNGDTGNNYDNQQGAMNNASNTSSAGVAAAYLFIGWLPAASGVANASSPCEAMVLNYNDTTFHKSELSFGGVRTGTAASNMFVGNNFGDWRNTAAITSVTVFLPSGNFVSGTVVSLYGLP